MSLLNPFYPADFNGLKNSGSYETLGQALINSVREGRLSAASHILSLGADPNFRFIAGRTPLHWAAWRLRPDICQALLVGGANPNLPDEWGARPLHAAALKGTQDLVLALIQVSDDLNAQDHEGESPLHWAVFGNNLDAVEALLEAGANPHQMDFEGLSPINLARRGADAPIQAALEAFELSALCPSPTPSRRAKRL